MGVQAHTRDFSEIGYFRIFAKPRGGRRREVTFFRGAPVEVTQIQTSDPFTDQLMTLNLPQVTGFDTLGYGDLDWLAPYSDIDVIWENTGVGTYQWTFEGYIVNPTISSNETQNSVSVEIKGALLLLDNYRAKPSFPSQPIPYERLMEMAFDPDDHPAQLAPFAIEWPEVAPGVPWNRRVPAAGADYKKAYRYAYLRPWGVAPGDIWTGFTTRSTGGWENMLTGFVQGLLSVMFEEGNAQWTIRKDKGRKPVLFLRQVPRSDDPNILEIDFGAPGVTANLQRDHSQSATTIFGEGQDDAGTTFSKAQVAVTKDGPFTDYEPFATQPSVWPVQTKDATGKGNPKRNPNIQPMEAHIKFPQGLDLSDAEALARAQRDRFADPGWTGTITLKVDPRLASGDPFPRLLIKAGGSIRLKGFLGLPGGVLFHITQSTININSMELTLTVDAKYRDALTVAEVRARTRDALTPLRSLQVGKYTNTVQDLLFPWSYELGSGILPSGGDKDATPFFKNVADDDVFPYERVTMAFPPKNYGSYYIKIPKNRARTDTKGSWTPVGVPIRMSANGTIRLSQIAAYDRNGKVLPVKFHVSIYSERGVSRTDMPILIGKGGGPRDFRYRYLKPPNTPAENYKVGQRYPFYETAWETVNENGEQYKDGEFNRYPSNAGLVVGWGNYFEPAGYSPGRASRGAAATGMLVDESQWGYDVSALLNPQKVSDNTKDPDRGRLYAMIYCDDLPNTDVFFLGRFFRVEPGGQ